MGASPINMSVYLSHSSISAYLAMTQRTSITAMQITPTTISSYKRVLSASLHNKCTCFSWESKHTNGRVSEKSTVGMAFSLFFHFHIGQNVKSVLFVNANCPLVFLLDLKAINVVGVSFFNKLKKSTTDAEPSEALL